MTCFKISFTIVLYLKLSLLTNTLGPPDDGILSATGDAEFSYYDEVPENAHIFKLLTFNCTISSYEKLSSFETGKLLHLKIWLAHIMQSYLSWDHTRCPLTTACSAARKEAGSKLEYNVFLRVNRRVVKKVCVSVTSVYVTTLGRKQSQRFSKAEDVSTFLTLNLGTSDILGLSDASELLLYRSFCPRLEEGTFNERRFIWNGWQISAAPFGLTHKNRCDVIWTPHLRYLISTKNECYGTSPGRYC